MYDLWYFLGRVVTDPTATANQLTFLDGLVPQKAGTQISRATTDIDYSVLPPVTQTVHSVVAVVVKNPETNQVRGSMAKIVANDCPVKVPVSFYSAARMVQFKTVSILYKDLLKIAVVYQQVLADWKTAGKAEPSGAFNALLGACLIDGQLRDKATNGQGNADTQVQEFGIKPGSDEILFLQKLNTKLSTPAAPGVAATIGSSFAFDGWSDGCGDIVFDWAGQSERAVH